MHTQPTFTAIMTREAMPVGGINGSRRRFVPVAYTVEVCGDRQKKVRRFVRGTIEAAQAWADELNQRQARGAF